MKKIVMAIVAASMLLPSVANATLIVRDGPTLAEIQAGIDACKAGDAENCKYERYPGLVRMTEGGTRILPASGNYILGDVLAEGTVMPKVEDARKLLSALQSDRKVTIVSYLPQELKLASTGELGQFLIDHVRHAAIPPEIVELAEQNGVTPIQMYEHIATGLGVSNQQVIDDLTAQHNAIVDALTAEVAALNIQIDALQTAIDALQAEHEVAIAALEAQIATLESDFVLLQLENSALKKQIEGHITEVILNVPNKKSPLPDAAHVTDVTDGYADGVVEADTSPIHGILISDHTSIYGPYMLLTTHLQALSEGLYLEIMQELRKAIEAAYAKGYTDGYSDGYTAGYKDGYADGYAAGGGNTNVSS